MILLDTHVWIWWVLGSPQLSSKHESLLKEAEAQGLGVSIMSCWEVAKLVELGRLKLPLDVASWIQVALDYPGIQLIDLTPEIVIEATQLPGTFHRDPMDQLLVSTARILGIPLATADGKILGYEHVLTLNFDR